MGLFLCGCNFRSLLLGTEVPHRLHLRQQLCLPVRE